MIDALLPGLKIGEGRLHRVQALQRRRRQLVPIGRLEALSQFRFGLFELFIVALQLSNIISEFREVRGRHAARQQTRGKY